MVYNTSDNFSSEEKIEKNRGEMEGSILYIMNREGYYLHRVFEKRPKIEGVNVPMTGRRVLQVEKPSAKPLRIEHGCLCKKQKEQCMVKNKSGDKTRKKQVRRYLEVSNY